MLSSLRIRALNYYKRNSARLVYKRPLAIRTAQPLISFTFDDFPQTALHAGGTVLERYSARGTYYVAFGLMGKDSPSGPVCTAEDLAVVLKQGHELGCHTFSHCHSWDTRTADFERSVIENREALRTLFPNENFQSLSYPIGEPRPSTKRTAARYFRCMRAGGQTLNAGAADLNQLSSYFLEQSGGQIEPVRALIRCNQERKGWLIFSTHDVCRNPSRYGCTPEFLQQVVECAVESGAEVLPVSEALDSLQGNRAARSDSAAGLRSASAALR